MQLKLTRSQRDGGLISKHAVFMLDARVQFTQEEHRHVDRYKLWGEIIYDSQAKNDLLERSANARAAGGRPVNYHGSVEGMLGSAAASAASSFYSGAKSLAFAALAAMKLRVTTRSLFQGQHIECKSLDELIGAEEAIRTACQNLRTYLDLAATFNGTEILVEYSGEGEVVIASATPQPALIVDNPTAVADQPAPVREAELRWAEPAEPVHAETVNASPEFAAEAATYEAASARYDSGGARSQLPFGLSNYTDEQLMIVIGAVAVFLLLLIVLASAH